MLFVCHFTHNHFLDIMLSDATSIANNIVSTFAGSTSGTSNGIGTSAKLNSPTGITLSSDETMLFVSDASTPAIRQIVISTAAVSTLSISGGSFSLSSPGVLAMDTSGSLFFADGARLGVLLSYSFNFITLIAGSASNTAGTNPSNICNSASGTSSLFKNINGIAFKSTDIWITDSTNNFIYKLIGSGNSYTVTLWIIATGSPGLNGITIIASSGNLRVVSTSNTIYETSSTSCNYIVSYCGQGNGSC